MAIEGFRVVIADGSLLFLRMEVEAELLIFFSLSLAFPPVF